MRCGGGEGTNGITAPEYEFHVGLKLRWVRISGTPAVSVELNSIRTARDGVENRGAFQVTEGRSRPRALSGPDRVFIKRVRVRNCTASQAGLSRPRRTSTRNLSKALPLPIAIKLELMSFPQRYKLELLQAIESIDLDPVEGAIEVLRKARDEGRHIFTCGNGGSAVHRLAFRAATS